MLLRFSVSNFLSFREKQEISMFARRESSHNNLLNKIDNLRVLNYTSIHGANASGKTNLIKAIDGGKHLILGGLDNKFIEKYHKFSSMKEKESYFDYELEIEGKVYAYGFSIILSKKQVVSEWLYQLYDTGNDKTIFTRDLIGKTFEYENKNKATDNAKKITGWLEDSLYIENELFLKSVISKNREDIDELALFSKVFSWFEEKLIIMYPNTQIHSFDLIVNNKFNIADTICKLDTGIKSISKMVISKEYLPEQYQKDVFKRILDDLKEEILKNNNNPIGLSDGANLFQIKLDEELNEFIFEKMMFRHIELDGAESLNLHEESDGTRRMIDLLMYMTNAKEKGQTLLIDEIERSLHPNLVNALISFYTKSKKNNRTQLIYTTHDENFIDLTLYRKDTIWFVDKSIEGVSQLTSMDEFKVRNDRKTVKNDYLDGRFGGVPIISNLVMNDEQENDEYEG